MSSPNRTLIPAALSISALVLAACGEGGEKRYSVPTSEGAADVTIKGSGDEQQITLKAPDGQTATISADPNAAAAARPAFAPPYPGAVATAAVSGASGADRGGMDTYQTADKPDQVIAFYKAQAQAAGLTEKGAMNQGSTQAFTAEGTNGQSLSVTATPTGAATSAMVIWSRGTG